MEDRLRTARVKVIDEREMVVVPVSSGKPEIPDAVERKWQKIVDLVARIMGVPTGLITRFTQENLEIFVASSTEGNPYKKDDHDRLGIGMFCETVVGRREGMLVQDTATVDYWKNNPHAGFGMRSYLGVPILWEDGELFGTFCMLNDQTNRFTEDFRELMFQFKEIIESDLKYILLNEELKEMLSARDLQIREIHHRIKNHFNLLISLITLQEMERMGNVEGILKDLQGRIRTLSVLHEKLQTGEYGESLPLDRYLDDLVHAAVKELAGSSARIVTEIEPFTLSVDRCVTLGLIVSELVSNALKYGSPAGKTPEIRLTVHREGEYLSVMFSDNGPGYPDDAIAEEGGSLGMNLIRMLTEQLGGQAEFVNRNGAIFKARLTI